MTVTDGCMSEIDCNQLVNITYSHFNIGYSNNGPTVNIYLMGILSTLYCSTRS